MNDFWIPVSRVLRMTFYVLLLSLIPWYFSSGRLFWQGFMLGIAVSLLNGLILMRKTIQTGEAAVKGGRMKGTGMLQRFVMAVFAVYVALKFPELFSLTGVIGGLTVLPLISFLVFYFYYYKRHIKAGK